jgi:hypothetical protein
MWPLSFFSWTVFEMRANLKTRPPQVLLHSIPFPGLMSGTFLVGGHFGKTRRRVGELRLLLPVRKWCCFSQHNNAGLHKCEVFFDFLAFFLQPLYNIRASLPPRVFLGRLFCRQVYSEQQSGHRACIRFNQGLHGFYYNSSWCFTNAHSP